MKLSEDEERAIKSLKRIAKKFPKSLWLFSANGTLCIMKKKPDGTIATLATGGMDQSYHIDSIHIENGGGDW